MSFISIAADWWVILIVVFWLATGVACTVYWFTLGSCYGEWGQESMLLNRGRLILLTIWQWYFIYWAMGHSGFEHGWTIHLRDEAASFLLILAGLLNIEAIIGWKHDKRADLA